MKEAKGDLWEYPADATVITTNGFVKENGYAVMGRGCAFEACQRYPGMERLLGRYIQTAGNHLACFDMTPTADTSDILITFPVKHNWWETADIELIEKSTSELVSAVKRLEIGTVVMPRPGCGNGRLKWKDVKKVIELYLDDRYTVITYA